MKLLVLSVALFVGAVVKADPPVVQLQNGQVAGYVKNLDPDEGAHAYVYEGIPYGK